MTTLELFTSPGSCGDVSLIALEHVGAPYEARLLRFMAGEHHRPEYKRLNPKSKVPLLLMDGEPLTETPAILGYLALRYPESRLLPLGGGLLADARVHADLAWVASALHPLVTRIFLPSISCDIASAQPRIKEIAGTMMAANLAIIEERLADREWLHGAWSAVDAYVFWVHNRLAGAGFDLGPFIRYREHAARMHTVPAVQRAWAKRADFEATLRAEGLMIGAPPAR